MIKSAIKIIVSTLLLPLLLIRDTVKSRRSRVKKLLFFILILIFFVPGWWSVYSDFISSVNYTLYDLGITDRIRKIKVSGTSMLPAIKDGSEVDLNSPKKYGLHKFDIVSFKNRETGGLYYLKRIIGIPDEEISIRNGMVIVDGKILVEDYVLNNLPTFGNTYLLDCGSVKIPQEHFFVMGDNRTVSSDSRILGLVKKEEIEGVIRTDIKEKFASDQFQTKILKKDIDPLEFLKKINDLRSKNNASSLVTYDRLIDLAADRAGQISENLSDWKNKTTPVEKLLDDSGYSFNLVHEFVTFGYIDEQQVADQIMDLSTQKDIFLSNSFTEVGIGVSEAKDKECTFPVISVIISWPTKPTYEKSIVDSWEKEITLTQQSLDNLQTWLPIVEDKYKLRHLINLVAKQNGIAKRIYQKLSAKDWLDTRDTQDAANYNDLVKESSTLQEELFGKSR